MNKFRNYLLMAAGFAVLAGVVSGITAGPAIAQAVKAALVRNVDEPGRSPFQSGSTGGSGSCDATLCREGEVFNGPPPNTRLVVKDVSINFS